ncbi:MAG TPA: ABC transporter substrate-binding protein [Casimicrobiaceae bacterium]|nr:ABC transporter substrate-binding protein [Casimicrobiaceae bacterium]
MKALVFAAAAALVIALPAQAQQQGVTPDTVTIGAHGPITGPAAYIGLAGRDGMLLAIKEINAAGGVNGRKIAAVFEDDGHTPTKALAAVKKLVENDKVFMIMSVGGSNATVGAVDYMKEKGVPYYVSIASAPQVTWPHARNLFRGGTTETARYGELYAEFLATNYKAKRIAIMSGREEYPRNEGDATVDKLKNWFQMAPVARVEFNIGDKDFTPQLVEVQKANPEVIAFFGNPAEAAIAMRQAKELGLKQPFFVGSNMVDPSLITAAKSNAEGVVGFSLIPYLPGSKAAEMVKWEAAWKKEYPNAPAGRPNNFDLLAYGDTYVVAEAMKRAGKDLTSDSFIRALEGIHDYRVGAVATPRTFSTKHHIGNLTLVPMMVKNGEWEPLQWSSTRQSDILKRYE